MSSHAFQAAYNRIAELDEGAGHAALDRKAAGITYTPPAVALSMVRWLDPLDHESIHEPSCGRGVFLVALAEHWLGEGRTADWVNTWAQAKLRAGDLDERAVSDARAIWHNLLQSLGVKNPYPLQAHVEDGLFGSAASHPVDIILGNPPYVRFQNLSDALRKKIAERYPSCREGNVDLYYAFLEDALNRAKRVCYIMPNSWMANASAKALRARVIERLDGLIDFGSRLVFAPVRAYTAIVRCHETKKVGDSVQVRGSLPEEPGEWMRVPRQSSAWAPTRFTPLAKAVMAQDQQLGDLAEIVSGIATLADSSFLLPHPALVQDAQGQNWVEQTDPDHPGHTLRIPEAFAPRLVKLTRPVWGPQGPRILHPYLDDGSLASEDELRQHAPDLLSWLQRRRVVLDGRDKGKTHLHEAWYAYGRRQGFWTPKHPQEKLLAVPMMGRGRLVAHDIDISTLGGRFLFTSGFLVRPKSDDQRAALQAVLQSPASWDFVVAEGKAWAGAGDYRSLGARALRRLPVALMAAK